MATVVQEIFGIILKMELLPLKTVFPKVLAVLKKGWRTFQRREKVYHGAVIPVLKISSK